jgi:hypothetical protein
MIDTQIKCSYCKEHTVLDGLCKGCGDQISTHCDASNSAIQCQDCGDWFGYCCCMNNDNRGNRCNACYAKNQPGKTAAAEVMQ